MSSPPVALREAIRARTRPAVARAAAAAAAQVLAQAAGAELRGVVFFGSRRTEAGADPWSAYDFFVLTRAYRGFYSALRKAGKVKRSPAVLALLNALLPPSQVSLWLGTPDAPLHAKCSVLSFTAFLRETSRRRHDHFCIGRLFQPSEIVHAADEATAERILDGLVSAHEETYRWVRPWLPAQFDAEAYGRTLLRVSMAREIRPEPPGRADALWEVQRREQGPVYALLLETLAAGGELRPSGEAPGTYQLVRPVSAAERLGIQAYFAWSLLRATARWGKHVFTFEGWLDYILRKARRHVGEEIVLSPRERRWPLLFLWPRFFRYLRRRGRGGPP
ncbi:MAG TPA: hypothetical protein VN461_02645 [Vicinamibacteria bacterium]|nr:hypothetical protein [Vicinamibacteria bacterium]